MTLLIPFLYADQSLAELSRSIGGSAHSGDSGLTTLLRAHALSAAGLHDAAANLLVGLIETDTPQTRVKLWAAAALRERGRRPGGPAAVEIQGVVIDVPAPGGRDVLGVYRDGSARFVSNSGAVAVYDAGRPAISAMCRDIVAAAAHVFAAPEEPVHDRCRPKVTLLTLSGPIVAGSEPPLDDIFTRATELSAELVRAGYCTIGFP